MAKRFVIGLALLASACGGSPKPPTAPTPPTPAPFAISCPAPTSATVVTGTSVAVSFPSPSTSGGTAPARVSCSRESGSLFELGTTTVQCSAQDAAGQSASCSFEVIVTPPPPRLRRIKFLAFGDSLTAGEVTVPTSAAASAGRGYVLRVVPSASYPARLLELLKARFAAQAADLEVTNAGLPNEWAQDGVKRFPDVVVSTRPEVVILLEGINDIAQMAVGGIPPAGAAVGAMAREARSRGADVLVASLPPNRATGDHALENTLIMQYNERLRQTAQIEGALFVDLYAGMIGDVNRYIGVDGLHPNEEGYARMAELISEVIRANFEAK